MIFFGWGKKSVPLGSLGAYSCAQCGLVRPFTMVLNYSYFRLYFIFGVVTQKRYIAACNVCSRGALMDKSQIDSVVQEGSIPFMDKWGLALLAAALVAIVVLFIARV